MLLLLLLLVAVDVLVWVRGKGWTDNANVAWKFVVAEGKDGWTCRAHGRDVRVLVNLVAKGKTDVRAMRVGVPKSVGVWTKRKNGECPFGMNEQRTFGSMQARAFGCHAVKKGE